MDGDSLFVACKEDLEERDQNPGRCLGSTNCSKVPLAFLLPTRGLHVTVAPDRFAPFIAVYAAIHGPALPTL
jgi:hypothetical protein